MPDVEIVLQIKQRALVRTPKVLNSKAQGRPELREGRTLGWQEYNHCYAEGVKQVDGTHAANV
jgi:hypothetical protein